MEKSQPFQLLKQILLYSHEKMDYQNADLSLLQSQEQIKKLKKENLITEEQLDCHLSEYSTQNNHFTQVTSQSNNEDTNIAAMLDLSIIGVQKDMNNGYSNNDFNHQVSLRNMPVWINKNIKEEGEVSYPNPSEFDEMQRYYIDQPPKRLSKNAKQIQNKLYSLLELSDTESEDESTSYIQYDKENRYQGFRLQNLQNIKKYKVNTSALPVLKVKFDQPKPEELLNLLNKYKIKSLGVQSKNTKMSSTYPYQNASIVKKKNISKMDVALIKKYWTNLAKRDIPKHHKNFYKLRSNLKNNIKRFAQLCIREQQRKAIKTLRAAKESSLRSKKLSREITSFWKRRERETADMRKKREKEEMEARKKQDEETELILQKRRLEYLMKQSDIYSHFMAQKLGIAPLQFQSSKVEINEEEAKESIKNIIQENRNRLKMDYGQNFDNQDLRELGSINSFDQSIPQTVIDVPVSFNGDLKPYQLKGLRWLDSLYEQGINGILADEMGLGKTIQAISLICHLSSYKNNWGPFIVVCPASTLYNWQNEFQKFAPSLRVLPYWGGRKERKTLKKSLNPRLMYSKDSPFHVFITSYQLITRDETTFHKIRWQYMILDEAQAIKNTQSQRWKQLLSFNSRNRLLLTGTPIQNSMAELWALLHFIMPKLFDSHEQFQEWFSKDIEAHSQDSGQLNQHQIQRLHAILKPFMLRRVKKDVESELGQKTEYDLHCQMTSRQKKLYYGIKQRLNVSELFQNIDTKNNMESLMNLIMQFRKVCNHPELFERRQENSPYLFGINNHNKQEFIAYNTKSHIQVQIPILLLHFFLKVQWSKIPIMMDYSAFDSISIFINLMSIKLFNLYYEEKVISTMFLYFHYKKQKRLNRYYKDNFKQTNLLTSCFSEWSLKGKIKEVNLKQYNNSKILSKLYKHKVIASTVDMGIKQEKYLNPYFPQIQKMLYNIKHVRSGVQYKQLNEYTDSIQQNWNYDMEIKYNSKIDLPDMEKLILDCGKLRIFDNLMSRLYNEGHRCLVFCQMTKMLDILEDYLTYKKWDYVRMDGSTSIIDRRDMVNLFQTKPIFCFILSTRAGGLGVNLTAADTVIFYDNDWNPTMDAQACDRVHRIGQTKPVSVYRLITQGTVEERIVKRAKQKQQVQSTVYAGSAFKADVFKPSELQELLMDKDGEQQENFPKFMPGKKRQKKTDKTQEESKVNVEDKEFDTTDMVLDEIN